MWKKEAEQELLESEGDVARKNGQRVASLLALKMEEEAKGQGMWAVSRAGKGKKRFPLQLPKRSTVLP